MNKRILVIGHELAEELARGSRSERILQGSEFVFVGSVAQAENLVGQGNVEAVITSLVDEDEAETRFLDQLREKHPETLRIVCADLSRSDLATRCLGRAHQVLNHPIDLRTLQTAVARATALQTWLPDANVQKLVAGIRRIPSPPALYFQVVRELQSSSASVGSVGEMVAKDVAMTAKLLQMANSAVFGLSLQVTDPADAVMYLGVETTKSLILLAHTFSHFEGIDAASFSIDELWRHSLVTGQYARKVADAEDADPDLAAEAFTGGLLHDLGKLLMAANYPGEFSEALKKAKTDKCSLWQAERTLWKATHADVGAALLGVWALPLGVVEAVAWHHSPVCLLNRRFSALTAVHVANSFAHQSDTQRPSSIRDSLDEEYLRELGLLERLESWESVCLPDENNSFS